MSYVLPAKPEQPCGPGRADGPGVIRASATDPASQPAAPGGDVQQWRLVGHHGGTCGSSCGAPCASCTAGAGAEGPTGPACASCAACAGPAGPGGPGSPYGSIPRELDKVSLPDYIIEPPDILLIDTVRGSPLPPYRIEPLDALQIQVADALPNEPIAGIYVVEPEGTVNLGLSYGSVPVAGLSLEQARASITTQLRRVLTGPKVVVALAQTRGLQQLVRGEHLVRPDGTISLGVYGCAYVAGLNLCQAREAIEHYLSRFLLNPQISLDILGFNSKVYYIIFDGGGYGQQVYRMPVTGNETVLDAIGLVNGLPAVASRKKIWVARPSPADCGCDQVLPVDWNAVTQGGSTATNYQLLPGDRLYVKADPWICFDNNLAKVMAPFERMLGLTLLTQSVFQNNRNNNGFVGGVVIP
jgi:polysaccharide export outer membrane protein